MLLKKNLDSFLVKFHLIHLNIETFMQNGIAKSYENEGLKQGL